MASLRLNCCSDACSPVNRCAEEVAPSARVVLSDWLSGVQTDAYLDRFLVQVGLPPKARHYMGDTGFT
jgi:hypothetical protein